MPEYIDKTALYKEFLLLENCQRELAEEKEVDEYTFLKRQQALEAAICYRQFVANFPTADVAPVLHAKWIQCLETDEWTCSNCEVTQICFDFTPKELGMSYCPNCGAKCDLMDGDK